MHHRHEADLKAAIAGMAVGDTLVIPVRVMMEMGPLDVSSIIPWPWTIVERMSDGSFLIRRDPADDGENHADNGAQGLPAPREQPKLSG